jgi:MoaA/NifB/PqqE/SkfB family radical SAM enzyme
VLSTSAVLRFAANACLSAMLRRRALTCTWEVTYRCSAKCAFCGYWRQPSRAEKELTTSEIAEGLRRLCAAGCRLVNFTGGEPTLRPDLPEIIRSAARQELWTSVVTNGSLLTREKVNDLRKAGLCNLLVSLDSTIASDHDQHRGIPGLFQRVERCMDWLRADFLRSYHTGGIMWVVRPANLDQLDEVAEWADRRGVFLVVQALHGKKTGSGAGYGIPSPLAPADLTRLRRRHKSVLNSAGYLSGTAAFMDGSGEVPACKAGRKYFSVDPYGYLHPCVDLPAQGHVLKDSLSVLRSPQAQESVNACTGCWYCFRGESDCSLGVSGCLSKICVASRVLWRNATSPQTLRGVSAE